MKRFQDRVTLVTGAASGIGAACARASVAFGCPIHNVYAASEFLLTAFSCPHDWLHLNSDWAMLEPVDEDL